ncbi:MAG: Si-specific NAD(P)(+) transhydrogenase [Chromatiales bacterium]|nr:Si-specific NAD(P)(+) transhydrogenase [Chromatiales bacterium]
MGTKNYDVIVIGSGPGGEGAAMKARKEGKRVAMVERHSRVGGGCTHWGTIPSKALRHVVQRLKEFNRDANLGHRIQIDYPDLLRSAESVIFSQVEMRTAAFERNNVDVFHGHAEFLDTHTVRVSLASHPDIKLHADNFVLATGSRPYHPNDVDFSHKRIHDADSILKLTDTPRSITIYGAGVIGCEYASIFRGLGVKVNLIDTRDQLLSFLDDEIIHALSYHLRDQGVMIRHRESYTSVEGTESHVTMHLASGKKIKSEILLWANGRTGNSDSLGLENIGLVPNNRGQLEVNEDYQTDHPHIYAVGDVIGYPSLASAAYDQGRFAATHLVFGQCDHRLVEDIPTGIYTSPEISSVGKTEKELTEAKIPYEVGLARFKNLARAQITGNTVGLLKILFHADTLEILGIHCFGDQASEIIHIGQAIMAQRDEANTLMYFVNTTFNYPTMAEAYRVAALNGLNRLDGV